MKKGTVKKTKVELPKTNYEDYVAVKQKEQQEAEMMEAMMQSQAYLDEPTDMHSPPEILPFKVKPSASRIRGSDLAQSTPNLGESSLTTEDLDEPELSPNGFPKIKALKHIPKPTFGTNFEKRKGVRDYTVRHAMDCDGFELQQQQPYMEVSIRTEMEYQEPLFELEASEAKLPNDIEMFDEVRNGLKIFRTSDSTLIYAIVVDKKNELNKAVAIRCHGGVAFGGYVRDCSGDAYLVECYQAVHLGAVPFSYRLEMPKAGCWSVEIPIPEKVLESVFAPPQRKNLSDLRERFPADRYEIQYLQMLLAN